MPAGPSKLRLLHPKWLLLHAFTVTACVTMVLLGRWQWQVAHRHHGDIRYYAYAFQWWAFVGFALLMWYRIILDYLRKRPVVEPGPPAIETSRYQAYRPPPAPVDDDPERARFNAYLAQLQAADDPLQPPRPSDHHPETDQQPETIDQHPKTQRPETIDRKSGE